MIDFAREPIAKVVTVLARTRDPAVFHCAAGKDRTGVISALLLSLLGVREEVIVADYAATRESLDAIVERLLASDGYQGMFENLPPTRCTPSRRRWRDFSRACAASSAG